MNFNKRSDGLGDYDDDIPKQIKRKKRRRENRKACMLYPEDDFKNNWDLFITMILILTCIVTPVRIAFYEEDDVSWTIINYTIDFFFFIDIVVSFNSAFYDEDFRIVDSRRIISRDYVRGWFLIDLLSIFPFQPL